MLRRQAVGPGRGSSEGTSAPETKAARKAAMRDSPQACVDERRAFVVTVRDGCEARVYRAMLCRQGGVWSAEARHCEATRDSRDRSER